MRGVKLESEIVPPVAAANAANRTTCMAALSEEVCIARCHKRLSRELCLRLVGRAFVGGCCNQGVPESCRVSVAQQVRNAWRSVDEWLRLRRGACGEAIAVTGF